VLTQRHCDAVAFGVEEAADLLQVAISLDHVLNGRRLHEESVRALAFGDALDTLSICRDEHARPGRFHERPHSLVQRKVGVLVHTNLLHYLHS
jgi:hypothetical protein